MLKALADPRPGALAALGEFLGMLAAGGRKAGTQRRPCC
jgi:hypothetical protein